jgi:hypothetical protein
MLSSSDSDYGRLSAFLVQAFGRRVAKLQKPCFELTKNGDEVNYKYLY